MKRFMFCILLLALVILQENDAISFNKEKVRNILAQLDEIDLKKLEAFLIRHARGENTRIRENPDKSSDVNQAADTLLGYYSSTPEIHRIGVIATRRLAAIRAYKKVWDKEKCDVTSEDIKNGDNQIQRKCLQGHLTDRNDVIEKEETKGQRYIKRVQNPRKSFWKSVVENLSKPQSSQNGKNLQDARYYDPDIQPYISYWDWDDCLHPEIQCSEETKHWRTINGTCNNKLMPHWGSGNRSQARLLWPEYFDWVGSPRRSSTYDGSFLPSARAVSREILGQEKPGSETDSPVATLMMMQMGQFIDHDMTHTPLINLTDYQEVDCKFEVCDDEVLEQLDAENSPCYPIQMEDGTCMPFVRSEPIIAENCLNEYDTSQDPNVPIDTTTGERQHPNAITAWLDMSQVYGSSERELDELRDYSDPGRGRMRVSVDRFKPNLKPLLPKQQDEMCKGKVSGKVQCFHAGDVRQNEQVGLMSMHTVFIRMHNHIEKQLQKRNSQLNGEELFQLSRKVLIGMWQHMVYNEYLPVILGDEIVTRFQIKPLKPLKFTSEEYEYDEYGNDCGYGNKRPYFCGYDNYTNGDIVNVFSTAAFRFGHSEVQNLMTFVNQRYEDAKTVHLTQLMFDPATIYSTPVDTMIGNSDLDSLVLGLVSTTAGDVDRFFAEQIRDHLFTPDPPNGRGMDLPALNIQRGRDHGLQGYIYWRDLCFLDEELPTDFNQLVDLPRHVRNQLEAIYKNVADIDLYPAAMAEYPVHGGLIGPTFACIIALQMRNLKIGDRFYYENRYYDEEADDYVAEFTPKQLREIRSFSLARLLCDTLDVVRAIQPLVMLRKEVNPRHISDLFENGNWRRGCKKIPNIDYKRFAQNE